MNKHVVVFDGDCGFCKSSVNVIRKLDWLKKISYIPFQQEGVFNKYKFLTKEMCSKELFLILPSGKCYGGYDAFNRILLILPITFLFSWFFFLPGIIQVGKWTYKLIAKNRHRFGSGKVCGE